MNNELTPAFILHRRRFRETSLLLEVLSPLAGRLGLVARGALRGKRASPGLLQPFQPLKLSWAGRGSLPNLAKYEAAGTAYQLLGAKLYAGFYLNELVMRMTVRADPSPELFAAYATSLSQLASAADIEPVLRQFEVALLDAVGLGLILDCEQATGASIDPNRHYHYGVDTGATLANRSGPGTDAISGKTLLALAGHEAWSGEALRESKQLMRRVIRYHAGDRPFESRRLFAETLREPSTEARNTEPAETPLPQSESQADTNDSHKATDSGTQK